MLEVLEELRTDINTRIDKLIEIIKEKDADLVKSVNSFRKPSDNTKYTQFMFDFILYAHDNYILYNRQNPKDKKCIPDLTRVINERMLTHKSSTSLSQIWNGHLDRITLATGEAYFSYGKIKINERLN